MLSWTPEGFIGRLFATMKPFAPAPLLRVTAFASGAELRDNFEAHYGPTIAVYRALGDDRSRIDALDRALAELGDQAFSDAAVEWEYALVTARRV